MFKTDQFLSFLSKKHSFHSFISLLKILKNKNFVGADIVELAPEIDPTGNSAVFGTKVLREVSAVLLGSFNSSQGEV